LKFGRKIRTPAMQAGLTDRLLTFRDIFTAEFIFLVLGKLTVAFLQWFNSASLRLETFFCCLTTADDGSTRFAAVETADRRGRHAIGESFVGGYRVVL